LIGKSGVLQGFCRIFAEDLLPFFKGFSGVFPGDKFSYRVESEVFQRFFRGFATVFQGFFRKQGRFLLLSCVFLTKREWGEQDEIAKIFIQGWSQGLSTLFQTFFIGFL